MIYNKEQLLIIKSNAKNIFINAGAGTGKTTVILGRIQELLLRNVSGKDILALSFTRKAANILTKRLKNKNITSNTFHSIIYNLLKSKGLKKEIFTDNINHPFSQEELNMISKYKNKQIKIKPFIYYKYQTFLKENHLIDYDDLFLEFLNGNYHLKYKYIFVDEFQDTNNLQYEVLKKLSNNDTSFFCVGDPNQAIYAFRGSNYKIIQKFINEYQAKTYTLRINYRSQKNIITYANNFLRPIIFKSNFKDLIPNKNSGGVIRLLNFENDKEEAKKIIKLIKHFLIMGYKKSDIAIIAREELRLYQLKRYFNNTYLKTANLDNKISFMTIHKIKGLEYKIVFLVGLEKGIFPSNKTSSYRQYKEERNLFYVAITRAMNYLIITKSNKINKRYYLGSKFYYESILKLRFQKK